MHPGFVRTGAGPDSIAQSFVFQSHESIRARRKIHSALFDRITGTMKYFGGAQFIRECGKVLPRLRQGLAPASGDVNDRRIFVIVIVTEESEPESDLFKIAHAGDSLRFALCLREGRQEQPSQDGNDRDDDQQLDEGKSGRALRLRVPIVGEGGSFQFKIDAVPPAHSSKFSHILFQPAANVAIGAGQFPFCPSGGV